MQQIVLAYSGGLRTSSAIPWLKERHGAAVITVTLDLGLGRELEEVRDRALAGGALRAHVLDARDVFGHDCIVPAIKSDATACGFWPNPSTLSRGVIARKVAEIAEIEQATAIAHGCGRQWSPFERALRSLTALPLLSPAREWGMDRCELARYAAERGVPVASSVGAPYRVERNLWGRRILGEPVEMVPESLFTLTKPVALCPKEPAFVDVSFVGGVPTGINGVTMPFLDLIASLGTIAGEHGVGRGPVQHLAGGGWAMTESPAAAVLHAAHRELQRYVTPADLEKFASQVSLEYGALIARGDWFGALRRSLDAFVETLQERVTGTVRLELFKAAFSVTRRESEFGLSGDETGETAPAPPAFTL